MSRKKHGLMKRNYPLKGSRKISRREFTLVFGSLLLILAGIVGMRRRWYPTVFDRFHQYPIMKNFVENNPLLGGCFKGEIMLPNYQFPCAQNVPLGFPRQYQERRGPNWYFKRLCKIRNECHSITIGEKPLLSIIVPFHNNGNLTCKCIYELVLESLTYQSEIVVIDDASDRTESKIVESCTHKLKINYQTEIVIHRNSESLGYSLACNRGASIAKGMMLLFANNDMFVLSGAISILVETMIYDADVGLVGPTMVNEYSIQEMGGIIYKDGSAANAFRGQTTVPIEWQHKHEVDYISGACILVEKELFSRVGGFDPIYGRGYYEDTDLAMSIRKMGKKVILQPLAVVFHEEGNTFGSNTPEKVSLMQRNMRLFSQKWKRELLRHPEPGSTHGEAKSRYVKKSILWLDQTVPSPSFDSGSQRTEKMIQIFQSYGYKMHFNGMANQYTTKWAPAMFNLAFNGVASVEKVDCPGPQCKCPYELIVVSRPDTIDSSVLKQISKSSCSQTPIIYDTVDLHFLRISRRVYNLFNIPSEIPIQKLLACFQLIDGGNDNFNASICMDQIINNATVSNRILKNSEFLSALEMAADYYSKELEMATIAYKTLVVSPEEYNMIEKIGIDRHKLEIVSNIYDDARFEMDHNASNEYSRRRGGIFVGNFQHPPNIEAVDILCNISIKIAKEDPKFIMHIVGAHEPPEWLRKQMADSPHIRFHGWLSEQELENLYSTVFVSIVPLQTGAGVKGKVASAYLHQVPVIGTSIAAEGYGLKSGESILIANTSAQFVDSYLAMRSEYDLWKKILVNGLKRLSLMTSYSKARQALGCILSELNRNR